MSTNTTPVAGDLAPARVAWPAALGAGLAGGLIAGAFGVGGGIVLVPILVLWLGRRQHVAHATSLVAVALAATAGVVRFAVDGAVAPLGAAVLAVGAVAGARLGARFLPKVSEGRLRIAFVVLMLLLAVRFLIGSGATAATAGDVVPDLTLARVAVHLLGGLAAGAISSVFGVGGGVIMVPLLVLGLGYGQHIAEGTSLAVIVPTAVTGARAHHRNGYTDWMLGLRMGVGALVGAAVGASVALALAPDVLGRSFGVLQALAALVLLRKRRAPV